MHRLQSATAHKACAGEYRRIRSHLSPVGSVSPCRFVRCCWVAKPIRGLWRVHHVEVAVEDPGSECWGSFDEFFMLEQPRMVAVALALTGVPEVARDVAQDALVAAYRQWGRVSALERPGAWVRRVTINGSLSWHRSRRRERTALARLDPVEQYSLVEHDEEFWRSVRELPDRQRSVVALRYVDDLSVAEIASVLEIAQGTVKATLHAARQRLAQQLGVPVEEGGL